MEPDISVNLMFKKIEAIKNHKEWERRTIDLAINAEKELKIIAQTGEWITKYKDDPNFQKFLRNGGELKLITCEKFDDAGLHSDRQDKVEAVLKMMVESTPGHICIRYLPWGDISEHIKLNDHDNGMYMKRIAKSSIVAPVWVDGKEGCDLLTKMFEYYWDNKSIEGPNFGGLETFESLRF